MASLRRADGRATRRLMSPPGGSAAVPHADLCGIVSGAGCSTREAAPVRGRAVPLVRRLSSDFGDDEGYLFVITRVGHEPELDCGLRYEILPGAMFVLLPPGIVKVLVEYDHTART